MPFNSWCDFNKRTEFHQSSHDSRNRSANFQSVDQLCDWISHKSAPTQRDPRRYSSQINTNDSDFDNITHRDCIGCLLQHSMCKFSHWDESINTTDICEGSKWLKRNNGCSSLRSDFDFSQENIPLFHAFFFKNAAATQQHSLAISAQFDDFTFHFLSEKYRDIFDVPQIDLRCWHECVVMRDFHIKSADIHSNASRLDHLSHFQIAPLRFGDHSFAGENQHAFKWIKSFNNKF